MIITISGTSGSGKSSVGRALGARLGIPHIDIGDIFREQARRHDMDVIAFGNFAKTHPEIDNQIDDALLAHASAGRDIIIQARLSGLLTKMHNIPAYRVWITAAPEVRAGRVAAREGIAPADALHKVTARDRGDTVRYKQTYGLDLNDTSFYNAVIHSDNRSVEQIVDFLVTEVIAYGRK